MQLTKELIRAAIEDETIYPDGHGMFYPEAYKPHFDVAAMGLVHTFESDGTFKGTIFDNQGNPVQKMEAVYNLAFLSWLISNLGLPHSTATGRGFQAQQDYATLKAWAYSED